MKLHLPVGLLTAVLACMVNMASAATYTDLTSSWCDDVNNVIYNGRGYFAVESASSTSVDLTINLSALLNYVNSNDYKSGNYMLLWDDNAADYGLADNADTTVSTGSRTPSISGYWDNKAWNATTNNVSYSTLSQYATNGNLTLNITNSSSNGVYVSTKDQNGEAVTLYTASGLKASGNTVTNGYYVNLNYVTAVTLNTVSTLDTASYVPPADYSQPYVSQRTDGTTVGRLMFMGDSITHGVDDQTYRWQLFKTLTDNGIENEIAGPREGYHSNSQDGINETRDRGESYGGVEFANVHLAQSSGRTHNIISGSNSGMSGVNYGGHSTASTAANYDCNTWISLMGTNDMLSDSGSTTESYCTKMQNMLGGTVTYSDNKYTWTAGDNWGNMGKMVSDVYKSGDTYYMLSVTPWGTHRNNQGDTPRYAVQELNRNLEAWCSAYKAATGTNIVYVDITRGMVDMTSTQPFRGHDAFFNNATTSGDGLHPGEQGSLIMAGNLAQAMGIGGRTAGLSRMSSADWASANIGTVAAGSAPALFAENAFTMEGGYTIDLSANFGNGETDGWLSASSALSVTLGDGTYSGTLNLSEGYIMWGDDVLFCADNSQLSAEGNLRIAWHNGNTADNVLQGYYVWLGDMLIGQGLSATTDQNLNGILISATGADATINSLTWTDGAYAPTTTGLSSTENAYYTAQDAAAVSGLVQNGYIATMPDSMRNNTPTTSGVSYSGIAGTSVKGGANLVTGNPSTASTFVVTSTSGWIGLSNGSPTEAVSAQLIGKADGTIFGTMNNGNAATLTLEIENTATVNGTGKNYSPSTNVAIAGAYAGSNQHARVQSFNLYMNGGTVDGNIMGGSAAGYATIGEAKLVVNNGTVNGNIYGGAQAEAKSTVGRATIEVNGGTITGNIIAGGEKGTIGNTDVVIKGGTIKGDITKGGATRTQDAVATVTVEGNKASIGGNIEADKVTLKNIEKSGYSDGFDTYAGTITTDSLSLYNVKVQLQTTLRGLSMLELTGNSQTGLTLGNEYELKTLHLAAGTSFSAWKNSPSTPVTQNETNLTVGNLTAGAGATLNANLIFTAQSSLTLDGSLAMGSTVNLATGMSLTLSNEMLQSLYNGLVINLFTGVDSLLLDNQVISANSSTNVNGVFVNLEPDYSYMLTYSDNGTVSMNAIIPEPTTATLGILALTALAARRRRKNA